MNRTRFGGKHVHLMGIGGSGVSALVPLLKAAGATVSGCDLGAGANVRRLKDEGFTIHLGHDPAHAEGVDVLVHTSAVPTQHAELRAARQAGAEVLSRAACLAELMKGTPTLAVAGSHGKTSTSWMIGHLLVNAGRDPLVMVGGNVTDLGGGGSRVGAGEICVAEVDESDGGFLHTEPTVAVVTNLEAEHVRHYGSFSALCDAFNGWLKAMGPEGTVITGHRGLDPRVLKGVEGRIVTCGIDEGDVCARYLEMDPEGANFHVSIDGEDQGLVRVPIPGIHMVGNALLAIAAARNAAPDCDLQALERCGRVGRRFTVHGKPGGVRVVEDYAHHPTEILATLEAASLGEGRVHIIFQPHRYSRTADCFSDYAHAFDKAHAVAILPVYAAGEDPIAGAGGRDVAEAVAEHRAEQGVQRALTQYITQGLVAVGFITAHARNGDTVLVLGAGDVGGLAKPLVEALSA